MGIFFQACCTSPIGDKVGWCQSRSWILPVRPSCVEESTRCIPSVFTAKTNNTPVSLSHETFSFCFCLRTALLNPPVLPLKNTWQLADTSDKLLTNDIRKDRTNGVPSFLTIGCLSFAASRPSAATMWFFLTQMPIWKIQRKFSHLFFVWKLSDVLWQMKLIPRKLTLLTFVLSSVFFPASSVFLRN